TDAHSGHDAKVSATAKQGPKQLVFSLVFGGDEAAVRENHVCGSYIVERQAKAANQRPIAPAQCESSHTDGTARAACHSCEAARISHRKNIRGAGASRNSRGEMVRVDKHVVHAAQVDHEPIAQGATSPVVSTAPYRQRKTRVACC